MVGAQVPLRDLDSFSVTAQTLIELLEELLLHSDVVVRDSQNRNSVSLRGSRLILQRVDAVEELLLKEYEGALRVLEGALVAAELAEHSAGVEMGVGGVVNFLQSALDLEGFLEVLEAGASEGAKRALAARQSGRNYGKHNSIAISPRVELPLPPVITSQVIKSNRPPRWIPLRQNLRLLQQLQHHREVLLLEVCHGEEVAHFADYFAGSPDFFGVGTEEVLAEDEAAFHAFEGFEVVALGREWGMG